MTYKEWLDEGRALGKKLNITYWAVGDWLVLGEHTYGTKYLVGAEILGLAPQTLQNIHSAVLRFPPEKRRQGLSFAHHQTVAYKDQKSQDYWLNKAEKNGWSVARLREAIAGKSEPENYYRAAFEWDSHPGEKILEAVEKSGGRLKWEKVK